MRQHSLVAAICLWAFVLAGCMIEGGTTLPTPTPSSSATAVVQIVPTSAAAAAQADARDRTWAIGLIDQPADLYPYPTSAAAARTFAPIGELLFPSPILSFNYSYTTTGVLEQIPTLENGGAKLIKADVYLDATGAITTTATDVITQVDQLEVTFRWNPKLSWSDGTPVTADDSLFAYTAALAAPPSPEAADLIKQTLRYEKVDDHTTRATLRPDVIGPAYFLSYWLPLPRHLLASAAPATLRSSPFASAPIGYGPYSIESQSGNEIRMVRNPHYFGAPPAAERVIIAFLPNVDLLRSNLVSGNLDVVAADRFPPELLMQLGGKEDAALQTFAFPNPIWEHIDFNLDVPILQDIRVRRAIAIGTNREAINKTLFGGRTPVLDSWILPQQADAAPADQLTRYRYSPDEARKLLAEAGYTDQDGDGLVAGSDGVSLTLQLLTTDGSQVRQQIAQAFTADMRAIGIQIDIQKVPPDQLFSPDGPLHQRQFDMVLFAWLAGPEPSGVQLWSCAAVPSPDNGWVGDNFAGWCFRDADRAVRAAAVTSDAAARRAAYLRQQQLWTQEIPSLPLFQRLSVALAAKNVQGIVPDSLAPITWNIAAWKRAAP